MLWSKIGKVASTLALIGPAFLMPTGSAQASEVVEACFNAGVAYANSISTPGSSDWNSYLNEYLVDNCNMSSASDADDLIQQWLLNHCLHPGFCYSPDW